MEQIGIIFTTFLRDELLYKSVQSCIKNYTTNCRIIIVDQGNMTDEKMKWLNSLSLEVFHYQVPFNSGLSYSRNYGVQKAKELNCEYCFIASDSFLFNESFKKINDLTEFLNNTEYDIIGTELIPSICGWEAHLKLIEEKCFELDFIDKSPINSTCQTQFQSYKCDIMRNIFLAKTDILLDTKWDENLLLGEHEDEFWRLKLKGVKCCWTNHIICEKMTDRPPEYAKYRKINFNAGLQKVREKYNITGWVEYKNLDRAKNYQNTLILTNHSRMCYN